VAGVEWSNLTLAGAFIAGAVLATVAVLRVVRAVTAIFRRDDENPRTRTPPDDPS
jgi:hypothetical protein